MSETLYLKFDRNCSVKAGKVTIGDVATVLCEDKSIQAKVRAITLMDMPEKKDYRQIFSIMSVIEQINKVCPKVTISNIGECDFIIEYKRQEKKKAPTVILKAVLIGTVILFGSGFAIMTYNNDVQIPELFEKIYELVLGEGVNGNNILEISYSIGLTLGIIIFYNHFGGLRADSDPTPIEVQMRTFESDLDSAMIETASREGKEIDAG